MNRTVCLFVSLSLCLYTLTALTPFLLPLRYNKEMTNKSFVIHEENKQKSFKIILMFGVLFILTRKHI